MMALLALSWLPLLLTVMAAAHAAKTPLSSTILEPIDVFPTGRVPSERAGLFGPEVCVAGFGGANDRTCSNVTSPTLVPFLVSNSSAAQAIVMPGGGYMGLSYDREGTDIARWLNGIGVSAYVLKYRVPARDWLPYGEAPFMDAQRAISLVRQRMPKSSVGVVGFSAGGHLAARVSTSFDTRAYARVDATDDVSCKPDFTLLVYPGMSSHGIPGNVSAASPPHFIEQAEDDPFALCADGSWPALDYYKQLKTSGAPPSELHLYPEGGHAYGRCTVTDSKGDYAALVAATEPGGPPVQPAWLPWRPVCTWPDRAAAFLAGLGLAAPVLP